MIGVDKIKFCVRRHILKNRRVLFQVYPVPSNVGNRQSCLESVDPALEDPQAFMV